MNININILFDLHKYKCIFQHAYSLHIISMNFSIDLKYFYLRDQILIAIYLQLHVKAIQLVFEVLNLLNMSIQNIIFTCLLTYIHSLLPKCKEILSSYFSTKKILQYSVPVLSRKYLHSLHSSRISPMFCHKTLHKIQMPAQVHHKN